MTKKLDETFNLPPLEELKIENLEENLEDNLEETPENLPSTSVKTGPLANLHEDQHDIEAEEIRKKALDAFEDIMDVGRNVNPERSARIFEVAGQFLKTGLDASNSKSEKQLKAAKLKIEAKRLKIDDETLDAISSGERLIARRNDLIKQLMAENEEAIVDVESEDSEESAEEETKE